MNSNGPNRRPRSTLTTQTQDPRRSNDNRNHNGVVPDTATTPSFNGYKIIKSHPRKLKLRHIPLFIFSIVIFIYIYVIHLHIGASRENVTSTPLRNKSPTKSLHEKSVSSNPNPELIHIIQTRFMQHQPSLQSLGHARLELFATFCLPSLISQVNKNFIWIIRTDPELHPKLMSNLIKLLKGHENYILLGSNYNPEGFGRENDSIEEFLRANSRDDEVNSMAVVHSGNVTLLREAFDKSKHGAILLETRLDADDGLHRDFVKTVQSEARHLAVEGEGLWRIWCINYNVEWHPLDPFTALEEKNLTGMEGYLVMYSDPNICVTPGLTFGYGKGASRSNVAAGRLRHDEITRKITACTPDDNKKPKTKEINTACFSRLSKLSPGAIRSRTTTSAGMDNVITGNESHDKTNKLTTLKKNKSLLSKFNKQYFQQEKLWMGMGVLFGVSRKMARGARKFIVENVAKIAEDNLKGQCTPGHSCKNGTKEVLQSVSTN